MTIHAKDRYRLRSGRILGGFGGDFPKSCIVDTDRGAVYLQKVGAIKLM